MASEALSKETARAFIVGGSKDFDPRTHAEPGSSMLDLKPLRLHPALRDVTLPGSLQADTRPAAVRSN